MTTKEAIQSMLDGNRVRGKDWRSGQFISFEGNTIVDADGIYFYSLNMNLAEDWEIYEEPKPKQVIVIEKWLISTSNGYIVRELSETAVNMFYEAKEKIKLLDTYEVEL